jgi:predicted Zn-dependent protease
VHYACPRDCAFDRVTIQLSSTRELTNPWWITTVLHELGHAAGLNHVARQSEVMYPELGLLSPSAYSDGDIAGLQELARIRALATP